MSNVQPNGTVKCHLKIETNFHFHFDANGMAFHLSKHTRPAFVRKSYTSLGFLSHFLVHFVYFFCLFSFYFLFLSVLCDSVGFLVTFWLLWEGGGKGGWEGGERVVSIPNPVKFWPQYPVSR